MGMVLMVAVMVYFCFNDTATTEIYTLSLHDALPISSGTVPADIVIVAAGTASVGLLAPLGYTLPIIKRSEEHTSELQSQAYLVCRLLLE